MVAFDRHYIVQIRSREFVLSGPRWMVRSIYRYITTSRGQSGLAWDGFPVDFAKGTRQHIRHNIYFALDMFDSENVILKCDSPSGEHVKSVLHFIEVRQCLVVSTACVMLAHRYGRQWVTAHTTAQHSFMVAL